MTPVPSGGRRRTECPVCGRPFLVRADGLLRKHDAIATVVGEQYVLRCEGSYIDCTSEGTAT